MLLTIRVHCLFVELTTTQMCLSPSLTEHMHHSSEDGSSPARQAGKCFTNRALCFVVFAGNSMAAEKGAFGRVRGPHHGSSPIPTSSPPLAYGELHFLILEVRKIHGTHSGQ